MYKSYKGIVSLSFLAYITMTMLYMSVVGSFYMIQKQQMDDLNLQKQIGIILTEMQNYASSCEKVKPSFTSSTLDTLIYKNYNITPIYTNYFVELNIIYSNKIPNIYINELTKIKNNQATYRKQITACKDNNV